MAKYRIDTDGGSYEIETAEPGLSKLQQAGEVAKVYTKEFGKNLAQNAPEALGTTMGALASTGAGTIPAMAIQAGGAALGEGVRQATTDENLTPKERAMKVGGAALRGASGPIVSKAATALEPAAAWVGNKIADGAEALSGLKYETPGVLKEAFKDPSLMFQKGTDFARNLYEKVKGTLSPVAPELEELVPKIDTVQKALEMAKSGQLNEASALEARHVLDSIKNKVGRPAYAAARKMFDDIAKPAFSEADQAFGRGMKSEALTTVFPINKSGTPSIAKIATSGALARYAGNPYLQAAGLAMSPLVQGATATGLGLLSKPISAILNNRVATSGISDLIGQALNKGR